jgi:hypothetical protein
MAFGFLGFFLTFWLDASLGFKSRMLHICLYVFFAIGMVGGIWSMGESWVKFFAIKKKFRPDE